MQCSNRKAVRPTDGFYIRSRAEEHVDADGDDEDGEEGEEDEGVDDDGDAAGLEVAELDDPGLPGDLEEQPRDSRMNSTSAMNTGPQSDISVDKYPTVRTIILFSFSFSFSFFFAGAGARSDPKRERA
uniref:Uncharacterized protein n=1 Tax=Ananas comosus var. bracteatus TaxID=296719 RepID=A0A6V7NNL1_ANACO|nr:unnamed protein product [Ananas comosus var. bracteatus]